MRKNPKNSSYRDQTGRVFLFQVRELIFPIFKRYRLRLLVGFTALVCVDLLQLSIPRLIKKGVDGLDSATISQGGLLHLAFFILVIASLVVVLRFSWRYLIIGFSRILEKLIRNRIFSHILQMDAPFFERRTTGDLMAHASNDLSAVQMACGMGMVAAIDSLVMCFAAIGFMTAIDPLLTFFALLPMPLLAVATRILSAKLHKRFTTVQEQFSLLTEFSRSTLISVGLIKAYTMENFQTKRFGDLGQKYLFSNLKVAKIQGLISPLATLIGSMGMLMVLYFGGRLVIKEAITLGDFVAFISYLYMLIWPMMAIGWVANLVQRGATSLNRISDLINSQPELANPQIQNLPDIADKPGFKLEKLSFKYQKANETALKNLSLTLPPGINGITGRTGSGKSTLCKLLVRLYPVKDGTLFFEGHDVNTLPLDFIRSHIGYVAQEPTLFSNTIAENIALGRQHAHREEIILAARQAAVHEDIVNLPNGYDTVIGERGVKLSGGQRQRIALARALLCDRQVLIIDDGLSAVDVATEHEVFDSLKKLFVGKTVIIVSNRIKLLSMTDRITILAEGKIAHEGSHDELLEESSLYQSMFEKQMKQTPEEAPGRV